MEPPAAAAPQVETDDQTALLSKSRKKGGNCDRASAAFNIVNSIIGSGVIGLPYSMKEAGFPLGVLLLFVVAYITDYSIILLIKGGNLSSTKTYQELVRKTYGRVGYIILSTLQFLYPFIAMISYNIITGDTLTKVFQRIPGVGLDNVLTDRHFIILLTTIIFTLPLSLYQDIAKLGKISLISLILTIVILIIVMVRMVTFSPQVKSICTILDEGLMGPRIFNPYNCNMAELMMCLPLMTECHDVRVYIIQKSLGKPSRASATPKEDVRITQLAADHRDETPSVQEKHLKVERPKSENAWTFAKSNAVQAIGVMSFAFICNHNSFLIYGSLEEPTLKNWSQVTHVSVSLAFVISVVFAACGYMTFTGYTEGDIFENYCRDDNLATFGRFCYGVTVILTFPLECFVTREVIANVFFHGNLSTVFHIVVTVVIVAVATGVSLAYDCLGIVLELNGVLSATPLVFIIPSACYLRLSKERWNHSDNLISCLILAVGVLVMAVGFVMTVLHPQECSHGKEMFYCLPSNVSVHNSTVPP